MPDPRADPFARPGGAYDVRVLEPSPRAGETPPASAGGACHRLEPIPGDLAVTRRSLRTLASRVMSPARERADGQVGLRWTRGGFGTPFFGNDSQVRVEDGDLVVCTAGRERRDRVSTLPAAAELVGFELLKGDIELHGGPLEVSPNAMRFVADYLGFATSVLEELCASAPVEYEPTQVELWPEWLDLQVELGSERLGLRATCGASPGDAEYDEPYLYVVPQTVKPVGDLWTRGFRGAVLPYSELLAAADQRDCALGFFRSRVQAIHHGPRL